MSKEIDLIDKLAEFKIHGGFDSDHQIGKAISIVFDQINKRHRDEPMSVTLASMAQQIKKFWKNDFNKWARSEGIDAHFGKKHEQKVDDFVSVFKHVIDEYYDGSLVKAYRYRSNIRDAYIWKLSRKYSKEQK